MKAEVTYNGGRSYRLGSFNFIQGRTKTIQNPKVIQRCKDTVGFAVQMLKDKPPPVAVKLKTEVEEVVKKKAVQPVIEQPAPSSKRRFKRNSE